MRQRAIKRAHERIARRLRARHQGIRPVPEQGLFNFRCHENCVEYLRTHPGRGLRIAETVYLDEGEPYVEVQARTGASSTTVSRVSKALNGEQGGYRRILIKLEDQERGRA